MTADITTDTTTDQEETAGRPVLLAADADDLAVLSARFQDATVRGADLGYDAPAGRFALMANRFMHERRPGFWARLAGAPGFRCRAALHFNHVTKVDSQGLPDRRDVDTVLALLAIAFEPARTSPAEPEDTEGTAPALEGQVRLLFSGGAVIRLHATCLEAEARDLSPAWRAGRRPSHRP